MSRKPRSAPDGSQGQGAFHSFLEKVNRSVEDLSGETGSSRDVWFRGHPQRSYSLLPSLLRGYFDLKSERTRKHIHREESRLYREFAARIREFHGLVNEDWDNLFAMQHCGAPTRLLEWSESLAIGLYFALHRFDSAPGIPAPAIPDDPPCIWILNPYALNARACGGDALLSPQELGIEVEGSRSTRYRDLLRSARVSWQEPLAVHPMNRTTRMQLHRSWFTIHGDDYVGLDQLDRAGRFLACVEIPQSAEKYAREYLRGCGLDLLSLYRDLPHIGVHLSRCNAEEKLQFVKATAI